VTDHACIVCGVERWVPLYRSLVRCERCDFVRAADLPSPEELQEIYGAGYFEGDEYIDYLGDRAVHLLNFRRRLARITALTGKLESLYEIGCAYGLWLQVAAEQGIRVAGSDISADAVKYARETLKLNATAGEFEKVPMRPGDYQAFCMWDTLEHLAHPESALTKIAHTLPSGGWFFATTGDIGSPTARRQGKRWRLIHPPTHLQYFSRATVSSFLARHGLRTVNIWTEPMCRSLYGALGGMKLFGRGPARIAAHVASAFLPDPIARRVRFTLDLGDIMLVCARKD
jgi:SAM-dependent methyltransferase